MFLHVSNSSGLNLMYKLSVVLRTLQDSSREMLLIVLLIVRCCERCTSIIAPRGEDKPIYLDPTHLDSGPCSTQSHSGSSQLRAAGIPFFSSPIIHEQEGKPSDKQITFQVAPQILLQSKALTPHTFNLWQHWLLLLPKVTHWESGDITNLTGSHGTC